LSPLRAPRLPRVASGAFAAALTAYVAAAGWLVWRTAILEPYSDMYDWVARWDMFRADGDLWSYLWAPHNFHHLVWTFVVLALDITAFGGASYLFLAVGVFCLAATAAMLATTAAAAAGPGLRLVGGGIAAALSLMGAHILDVSADINTTYVHALAFAVAAILLAERPGRHPGLSGAGALALAVAASLGSAAGLAVWPALAFGAWRAGRRGWLTAILAVGGVFSGLYLLGESAPTQTGAGVGVPAASALARLTDAVLIFVNYLGLPWARAIPRLGWLIGMGVLAASLMAVVPRRPAEPDWRRRAARALVIFSLATAAMAGAARTGVIAPDLVPMRYAVFLIPLHVGLWILALPWLARAVQGRPRLMAGAVAAAALLLVAHQAVMGVFAVRTGDANLRLIADFREGRRTAPMQVTIYGDLDRAGALAQRLRREGLYQRELRPDPPPTGWEPVTGESGISASSTGR
jgi:hypothetical protein